MDEKRPLAEIEKKSLETIKGRKIIEIPLLFKLRSPVIKKELTEKYLKKVEEYQRDLKEWVQNYEQKIGKIDKLYIQSLTDADEEGLKKIKQIKDKENIYYQLIRELINKGAKLQATEDVDLLNESFAWLSQIQSIDVLDVDLQLYLQTIHDRDDFIINRVAETLEEGETAILLIGVEHSMNFPNDIEVIKFRPPVYDDIIKLI